MSRNKEYTVIENMYHINWFLRLENNNLIAYFDCDSCPGKVVVHVHNMATRKEIGSFIFDDCDNESYYKRQKNFSYIEDTLWKFSDYKHIKK